MRILLVEDEKGISSAICQMLKKENFAVDPVYTGKAFAGFIAMAREGAFGLEDKVLFIHTGGAGGLFAIL